jgi:6-pyruvoyltetrahydropterin/6-carboxytetrahydropterin synthase
MSKTARLVVRFSFAAAHHLQHHSGACANVHGHTWRGHVVVEAPVNERTGMAVDFGDLKQYVDGVLPDHVDLNEVILQPTCELLADWLVLSFRTVLPVEIKVREVELWESDRCGVRATV